MSDKTCKTCKWWSETSKPTPDPSDRPQGATETHRFCVSDKITPDTIGQSLDAASYSERFGEPDLGSYFLTGQDFGCIHHEAKE